MATNYLRCETCGVDAPRWLNHGEDKIREVVQHWSAISELRGTFWIEVGVGATSYERPNLFEFIGQHLDHMLVLRNDFGDTRPLGAKPRGRSSNQNGPEAAVRAAILDEREACAGTADQMAVKCEVYKLDPAVAEACRELAAAIRARANADR